MSNIQKILNMTGPLTSQQVIERFFGLLSNKSIHTLSPKEIERIRMFTNADCIEFLEECLASYVKLQKIPSKKEMVAKSPSRHTYLSENLSGSLKDQGYEYGLSDW